MLRSLLPSHVSNLLRGPACFPGAHAARDRPDLVRRGEIDGTDALESFEVSYGARSSGRGAGSHMRCSDTARDELMASDRR